MDLTTKLKIHKAKTNTNKRRNKRIHNYSWRFMSLSLIEKIIRQKINTDI